MHEIPSHFRLVVEAARQHTVGLFRTDTKHGQLLVGSGVLARIAGRLFVLTAAHVLRHFEDGQFLLPGADRFYRLPLRSLEVDYIPGQTIDADLVVLQVPDETETALAGVYRFADEGAFAQVPEEHPLTFFLAVGCRESKNKPRPTFVGRVRIATNYLVSRKLSNVSPLYDRGKRSHVHVAINVPTKNVKDENFYRTRLFKLNGMSGGGVWSTTLCPHTAEPGPVRLVAILIEHHPDKSLYVGTRASYALALARSYA